MQTTKFTAYAITTSYEVHAGSAPFEHTFVVSEAGDNWYCYGRGKETIGNGARELLQSEGLAEWGRLLYGNEPFPTGLLEKVEGVCQTAANRILVLAGRDVSEANGNLMATLVYGKYGFHVPEYVQRIKETAEQLNDREPGAVAEAELRRVLETIGADTDDELKMLEAHFQGALPATITPAQNEQLLVPYREFQAKRQKVFEEVWLNKESQNDRVRFQTQFGQRIQPLLVECLLSFAEILGATGYDEMFKAAPEAVVGHVLRI